MNWLDKILLPQETIELGELNRIWEKFNNGEDVMDNILDRKWKYHKDKVKLLLFIIKCHINK